MAALGNWTLAFNLVDIKERRILQSYAGFAEGYPWSISYLGKSQELVVSYFFKNAAKNCFEAHCDTL